MSQLLPSLAELEQHAQAQPEFASWRQGYGPFGHKLETQAAVFRLAHQLVQAGHRRTWPPSTGCCRRSIESLARPCGWWCT